MPSVLTRLAILVPLLAVAGDFTFEYGGITRGDPNERKIALVFTGDEFADGASHIRHVLDTTEVKGSFFFTGRFYRNPDFAEEIRNLRDQGHYLGAHSDQHLLYCSWEDRDSLLVTQQQFKKDVIDNYLEMNRFGIDRSDAPFFMPAYEWYNDAISSWTRELGLQLINYSPGTRSHADYTTPDMGAGYLSSDVIMDSIVSFEESRGLNGFILLTHIGTAPERTDKFYARLGPLIQLLKEKGYAFVRIDELLGE